MAGETRQAPDSLPETVEKLEEAKQILEGVEAAALSNVALVLSEAAETLS
jgi:hypothetical protein